MGVVTIKVNHSEMVFYWNTHIVLLLLNVS